MVKAASEVQEHINIAFLIENDDKEVVLAVDDAYNVVYWDEKEFLRMCERIPDNNYNLQIAYMMYLVGKFAR